MKSSQVYKVKWRTRSSD